MPIDPLFSRACARGWPALIFSILMATAPGRAAGAFAWEYSTPEEQGVDSALLARMLLQVQHDSIDIDGFILVRHDRIVAEAYVYPYTAATRHVQYSASKSFISALVGIAIERGLFSSENERIVDLFQGVAPSPPSPNLSQMTLRHLLTMSTGHATDTTYRIVYTSDWVRSFFNLPVENAPGAPFVYNSGATFMLSAAIQRRAGVNAATYGATHLFGPLGITDWRWDVAPGNITTGGWGLYLRPLDMARFGLLYLRNGVWNGQQIVPAGWVAESGRKQVETGPSGTFWESGYGYQFWINDFGGYRADGARGQFIFILPEHDAVVVFTANLPDNWIPGDLARTFVIPALETWGPLPANPKANALFARYGEVLVARPTPASAAPLFTELPADQVAAPGGSALFAVGVSGNPAPAIQWYRDGVALPDATHATLTLASVSWGDAGEYTAVAHNTAGRLVSLPVTLTVEAAPVIRRAPAAQIVCAGDEAIFGVEARGGDLRYAWWRDGTLLRDANGATLRIPAVGAADAGRYKVTITNARGTVVSEPAILTIASATDASRLVNLSIRALAGAGDQTLIVGLTVAGADPTCGLPLLLRGVGPTLAEYNVSTPLLDPAIVLHAGPAPIAVNADWCGETIIADVGDRVGAFALPRASDDAALHTVLRPRTYTMHVTSSLPGLTGVALGECYEATGGAAMDGPRLVNVSARAPIATGEGTLIAGFAITGSAPMQVLLRGIGPTLANYNVTGCVADPELRLFSGDEVIAQNDDWDGEPALRDAFVRTGAFVLADDARDASLSITLPPGTYTAHVNGKNGGTGVALIEVYAVPE